MPPASQKYRTAMRDLLESPTNAVANAGREAARPKRLRYCTTSDHAAWGPPAAGETASATAVNPVNRPNRRATGASGRRTRTTAPRRAKSDPVSQRELLAHGKVIAPAVTFTGKLRPLDESSSASLNGCRPTAARASSPFRERMRIPGRAPSYHAWPDGMTQATQTLLPHAPALRPRSPGTWIARPASTTTRE